VRVFSYSSEWRRELRNIYDVLNPGGVLVCTFPNKYSSIFLPQIFLRRELQGRSVSYRELRAALSEIGFSEVKIVGFSRLLDVFYDWSNSKLSADLLWGAEKLLGLVLGPVLGVRLFYVVGRRPR
jgi:SAM-dependent methyltransferase